MRRLMAGFASFLFMLSASNVLAATDPLQAVCNSAQTADSAICAQNKAQGKDANPSNTNPIANPGAGSQGALEKVNNNLALIATMLAVFMIVVSGFQFVTAGGPSQKGGEGNPGKAKKARARLLAAVIGLLVIFLSWTFVSFIIQKFLK